MTVNDNHFFFLTVGSILMLLEIFPKIYSILITCLFFNTLLKSLKEKSYVLSGSHVADKTKTIKIKPMWNTEDHRDSRESHWTYKQKSACATSPKGLHTSNKHYFAETLEQFYCFNVHGTNTHNSMTVIKFNFI